MIALVPSPTLFGRIEWAFGLVETTPSYVPMAVQDGKPTQYTLFLRELSTQVLVDG